MLKKHVINLTLKPLCAIKMGWLTWYNLTNSSSSRQGLWFCTYPSPRGEVGCDGKIQVERAGRKVLCFQIVVFSCLA